MLRDMLEHILLVDDDAITNFIHTVILEKSRTAKKIKTVLGAEEGLEYLQERFTNHEDLPAVILLDINMPMMDGWEFVEAFNQLPEEIRKQIHIFFLTTSRDPVEIERAKKLRGVSGFLFKPLDQESLGTILKAVG